MNISRAVFGRILLGIGLLVAGADAREVRITVLHTTDLHGHIRPTDIHYPKEEAGVRIGGLARCATEIKRLRLSNSNCLLVDAGDTIQGTAASLLSGGLVMVRALNHLRYDSWTWGNHDFDWGVETLARCADASEVPLVAANIRGEVPAITRKLKPYIIREVDGVRVAILGLTTPGIPNWSRPWLIRGLTFEQSVAALRRILPEVKQQHPDIILLVAHQGSRFGDDDHANQMQAITTNFPEIHALVGGHTHRTVPAIFLHGVLYSQAGYWGSYLGRMELVYDTEQKKLARRHASLARMDTSVPQDAELLALCKPELTAAEKALARVIGTATGDIGVEGSRTRETPMHNLLCEAILQACDEAGHPADIVLHGVLDDREPIKQGPVTVGDCWRVVPYENYLGVFEATPDQLRELLEENAALYPRDRFSGVYGMKLSLKASAPPGERVVSITDERDRPFAPDRRLRVAVNSYDLASAGTRKPRLRAIAEAPGAKLAEIKTQMRDALIRHIETKKEIAPRVYGWWHTGRR